jgi:large subunit ribosomal protein L27
MLTTNHQLIQTYISNSFSTKTTPLLLENKTMLASFFSKSARPYRTMKTSQQIRWATKKAGGSTKNGRDSNPKFLGVKKYGNEQVQAGAIIVRQRGMKYRYDPDTCHIGKDHTIMAKIPGWVRFEKDSRKRQVVSILTEPLRNSRGNAL